MVTMDERINRSDAIKRSEGSFLNVRDLSALDWALASGAFRIENDRVNDRNNQVFRFVLFGRTYEGASEGLRVRREEGSCDGVALG